MFTANGERIAPMHGDPHFSHQQEGGKALLGILCSPFTNEEVQYETIRDVLNAVAEGKLTVAEAKAAISLIEHRRTVPALARPVELTAEGLQNGCVRLENACMRLENSLNALTLKMDEGCKQLDDWLSRHC